MKIMKTKIKEFEDYLKSIGGLKNGFYPDRPNIDYNLCSCGEGWLPLIQELIEKLVAAGWNKEICQIKSKFGGLRFYINSGTDEVHNIISEYERKSYAICEACGMPGELVVSKSGWYSTVCKLHQREDDRSHAEYLKEIESWRNKLTGKTE